jgi:hypothetical protein
MAPKAFREHTAATASRQRKANRMCYFPRKMELERFTAFLR